LHYRLFGSRAYLDLYGRPASVQEAAAHRYIHHAAQNKQADSLPATTPALQQIVRKQVVTNSSLAMVELIKGGSGLGPLPTAVLSIEPELEMLDAGVIASVTLWMYVRREVEQSARVKRVAEWLKQTFDGRTHPWFRTEFVHPRDFGEALKPKRPVLVTAEDGTA
jgi:DNA-binding transcriptional LysR family regulator